MKKYKVRIFGGLIKLRVEECVRETEATVWIQREGGAVAQRRKIAYGSYYFDTFQEAKEFAQARAVRDFGIKAKAKDKALKVLNEVEGWSEKELTG